MVVLLTGGLVWVSHRYTRETKRMANVMVREFESHVAPLLGFEAKVTAGSGWEWNDVLVSIHNLGVHPATLVEATVEYWIDDFPAVHRQQLRETNVPIGASEGREITVHLDLTPVPGSQRTTPTASGRLHFRLRYVVTGITGERIERASQDFKS